MKDIIDKAVKGGIPQEIADSIMEIYETRNKSKEIRAIWNATFHYTVLSHDFLKAFFGEELVCNPDWKEYDESKYHTNGIFKISNPLPAWQFHACKLVLSTDRKEYLKRFI